MLIAAIATLAVFGIAAAVINDKTNHLPRSKK